MIGEIISGVVKKLEEEFGGGETPKIYTGNSQRKTGVLDSKSPLREPNFYISCRTPGLSKKSKDRYFTSTQLLGNRYLRSVSLCVECRWFEDWHQILERLFRCLEYVPIEDSAEDSIVRGQSMQGEYVDDVLCFFVNYDVFVYIDEEKVKMQKVKMKKIKTEKIKTEK
ncbi:MAG: hypothetical protein FWG83_06515 [Oscillospiraceae bacterium]|nr:hypothetical protein [Oscillospiraceae bacterium]